MGLFNIIEMAREIYLMVHFPFKEIHCAPCHILFERLRPGLASYPVETSVMSEVQPHYNVAFSLERT